MTQMFKIYNTRFTVRVKVNMYLLFVLNAKFFSLKFGIVDADGYLSLYQTNWKCCPVTGSMPKPYLVSQDFLPLNFFNFYFKEIKNIYLSIKDKNVKSI